MVHLLSVWAFVSRSPHLKLKKHFFFYWLKWYVYDLCLDWLMCISPLSKCSQCQCNLQEPNWPNRLNRHTLVGKDVVIDFAHTRLHPDSSVALHYRRPTKLGSHWFRIKKKKAVHTKTLRKQGIITNTLFLKSL